MMQSNRRRFLTGMAAMASLAVVNRALAAEDSNALAADPRRPRFHLLPAANWMNDPNGPIYWNGKYHMFFQYNPHAAVWGDMHWYHSVSPDMVHWKHLPVAFAPTPGGPDSEGVFTGTAVVRDGQVVVLYTAVRSVPEEQATIRDGAHSLLETQCLATTTDPELKTWSKLPTPVLATPPPGMQVNGFRDPSPWRQGDGWYMVLGSGIENKGGAVLLYKSKNLRSWEFVHVLAARDGFGAHSPEPFDPWEVWECPDFFPLGKKHVLICSVAGKAYWQSGTLDPATMQFQSEHSGLLDYGSYYAPKTQLDKNGNRIIWGWITESRPEAEFKAAGWAGLMSLPRVLTLDTEGRLRTRVASEVDQLRGREQKLDGTALEAAKASQIAAMRIEAYSGEVLCTARRANDPYALALQSADGATTWIALKYDPLHPNQIMVDARPLPISLEEGEDLELHFYVDGSVIELFVNQRAAWTKRFYPAGSSAQDLRLSWTGKTANLHSLSVWQMSPISADRLTT